MQVAQHTDRYYPTIFSMGTTSFTDGVFDPNKCAIKCDQISAYEKAYYNGGELLQKGVPRCSSFPDASSFI